MSRLMTILVPFGLMLVLGCSALPSIFFGPAGKDAVESAEKAVEASKEKDPEQHKELEHEAVKKAEEAVIEAAAAAGGAPIDVTLR